MKRAFLTLWAFCLTLALSTRAYGQAEVFLLGHGATVVFSQSILFQMAFTLSGEPDVSRVASITLSWEVEGAEADSVSIDLARHITREPWGLNVLYPFAPDDSADLPPPMTPVFYTWVVTLADGSRATLDGELFYADPRFDWETAANDWLTLYTYSSSLSTSRLLESLQPVYDLVSQQTNAASTFRVVLYEPGDGYCPPTLNLTLSAITTSEPEQIPTPTPLPPCDPEVIAKTYHDAGIIPVLRRNANLLELQNVLANSMAKAAWRDVWDAAEVPGWFAEGLAQLYELAPHASAVSLAQNAVRAGISSGAPALQIAPTTTPNTRNPWYAQSVAMMLYLVDRYGPDVPARIARAIPFHPTFDEALIAVTARDTAEHLVHWRTWVLSDAAQIGNTWTPYLPSSPTPTLTRTRTPTLTPSPTPTPTLTAIPTRFGIPVQTPIPVTPTHIPTPRPPTNTPRPPAAATPTPAPSEGGGGGLCPGAVALGLLPLVALIARTRHRD